MGRARLTPGDDTVEIKVRVAAGDRERIVAASKFYDVSVAEFARRTLLAGCRRVEEHEGRKR